MLVLAPLLMQVLLLPLLLAGVPALGQVSVQVWAQEQVPLLVPV